MSALRTRVPHVIVTRALGERLPELQAPPLPPQLLLDLKKTPTGSQWESASAASSMLAHIPTALDAFTECTWLDYNYLLRFHFLEPSSSHASAGWVDVPATLLGEVVDALAEGFSSAHIVPVSELIQPLIDAGFGELVHVDETRLPWNVGVLRLHAVPLRVDNLPDGVPDPDLAYSLVGHYLEHGVNSANVPLLHRNGELLERVPGARLPLFYPGAWVRASVAGGLV